MHLLLTIERALALGIEAGDRVAIVAQLIPTEADRDEVMGRRSAFSLQRPEGQSVRNRFR